MSIASNTDWEIRTTGAETNGGGFKDLNPGTSVDYSQQDSAQLALTDIASDGAGTSIYSATGGFTAAMVGNCMYIAGGTGFTTGWYQITAYTDTNNITIDRSCGASKTGGTGNVGGAYKIGTGGTFATFFNTTNKGQYNVCHVKAGSYSLYHMYGQTIAATYFRLRGYNTTRNDSPIGVNRPLIDAGDSNGYINWSGGYGQMESVRVNSDYSTSSSSAMYASSTSFVMRNCRVSRSGCNAIAMGFSAMWGKAYQCEFESTLGSGIQISNYGVMLDYCWAHDCGVSGIRYSGTYSYGAVITNSVVSNCSTNGITVFYGSTANGNTIYNCGIGINFPQNYCACHNNIIQGCTTGINSGEKTWNDFNIVYGCTTAYSGGIVAGVNSLTSDPLLVDPANDNFTLAATSPAFNAGLKLGAAVGLP